MENGHVAVYDLCFFFIVSINGLLLLHFCKWRMTCNRIRLIVFSSSPLMDWNFYTSVNGEWQVAVYALLFFFIVSINGLIFIHFCKWRFWDIYIRKDACSLRSWLSLFWYPAISQFCDSIIRIAYHTAIYKYGYTIIHGCDGDGFSYPVTDHDATRKKATAAEKKRMAGTIMESGK